MIELTSEITLDTYKTLSKIDWEEGDEIFDAIITNYDEELHYTSEVPKPKCGFCELEKNGKLCLICKNKKKCWK